MYIHEKFQVMRMDPLNYDKYICEKCLGCSWKMGELWSLYIFLFLKSMTNVKVVAQTESD